MTQSKYTEGIDYEIIGEEPETNTAIVKLTDGRLYHIKRTRGGKLDGTSLTLAINGSPTKTQAATLPKSHSLSKDNLNVLEKTTFIQDSLRSRGRVDLFNAADVESQLQDYFKLSIDYGMKPTVSGFALALGLRRQRIYEIANGIKNGHTVHYSEDVAEVIRYYYNLLEVYFESTFVEGKIQPVVGIFIAKNHYGYKDQTENIILPVTPLADLQNPEDVAKKYLLDAGNYPENGRE